MPDTALDVDTQSSTVCAISGGGDLYCWGRNDEGQIGIGSDEEEIHVVSAVEAISGVVDVNVGYKFACALIEPDGIVYCWGLGDKGQLGDGVAEDGHNSNVPTIVGGLPDAALQVSAGRDHACALLDDRSIWCWGNGTAGQLGDGQSGSDHLSAVPVKVVGYGEE